MKDNPRIRRRIKILKLEAKKLSEERAACVRTYTHTHRHTYIHARARAREYIRISCIKFLITSDQLELDQTSAQADGTLPLFNL